MGASMAEFPQPGVNLHPRSPRGGFKVIPQPRGTFPAGDSRPDRETPCIFTQVASHGRSSADPDNPHHRGSAFQSVEILRFAQQDDQAVLSQLRAAPLPIATRFEIPGGTATRFETPGGITPRSGIPASREIAALHTFRARDGTELLHFSQPLCGRQLIYRLPGFDGLTFLQ